VNSEEVDLLHFSLAVVLAQMPIGLDHPRVTMADPGRYFMRRLPRIPLILVATPARLRGLTVPSNFTLRLSIPLAEAQSVIRSGRFIVLPLVHSQVPFGHVTMVAAMFCARAIVVTESSGISDYSESSDRRHRLDPRRPSDVSGLGADERDRGQRDKQCESLPPPCTTRSWRSCPRSNGISSTMAGHRHRALTSRSGRR